MTVGHNQKLFYFLFQSLSDLSVALFIIFSCLSFEVKIILHMYRTVNVFSTFSVHVLTLSLPLGKYH